MNASARNMMGLEEEEEEGTMRSCDSSHNIHSIGKGPIFLLLNK